MGFGRFGSLNASRDGRNGGGREEKEGGFPGISSSPPHFIQSHDMRTHMHFKQSDRRISQVQTGMLGKLRRKLKKDP